MVYLFIFMIIIIYLTFEALNMMMESDNVASLTTNASREHIQSKRKVSEEM